MGRVRGKRKKQTVAACNELVEEEKVPTYRKRGRPQKAVKDSAEDDSADKLHGEGAKATNTDEASGNGNERRSVSLTKENVDSMKEETSYDSKSSIIETVKPVGFRRSGNRRKSTPRRAAEVGVECN